MGFIKDFFKELANSRDVSDDEEISAELNQFLRDNSESSKAVAMYERNISTNDHKIGKDKLDEKVLKKAAKEAVQNYKLKNAQEVKDGKDEKEIGE